MPKEYFLKSINGFPSESDGNLQLNYNLTLPTPMIAKRRVPLGINPATSNASGWRFELDSITPRLQNISDLNNIQFPENYYIEKLDIYFNSFGVNQAWLSLPDKKLELVMVSNKNYKGQPDQQSISQASASGRGNKDNFTNALVHPANTSQDNPVIYGTIYSGGNGGDPDVDYTANPIGTYVNPTEWKIDETLASFGDNIYAHGKNRFNNPNITIEIDVRKFFRTGGLARVPISYPFSFSNGSKIKVKNIGVIKYNYSLDKVFRRNSVLFFRLSAGVPDSIQNGRSVLYGIDSYGSDINDLDVFNYDLGDGNTGTFTYEGSIEGSLGKTFMNTINQNHPGEYYTYFDVDYFKMRKNIYTSDFTPTLINTRTGLSCINATVIKPSNTDVIYKHRIFSDLSLPIYIVPKISRFYDNLNDLGEGNTFYCYGHQLKIGTK